MFFRLVSDAFQYFWIAEVLCLMFFQLRLEGHGTEVI